MSPFTLEAIPDLSGKVILITGGNAGLGKEAALQLAKRNPSQIFLASRSETKALTAIAEILQSVPTAHLTPIELDLASLPSVTHAAKKILASTPHLHILMNNAGIMAVPPATTPNGYEIHFGTNHLGHALLTKLLLPLLLTTAAHHPNPDVRIVTLSSHSHVRAPHPGIDFSRLRSADPDTSPFSKYAVSKLANILHAKQLAKRYPSIKVVAVHPGIVKTDLTSTMKRSFMLARLVAPVVACFSGVSVEKGVLNQLWGAVGEGVVSGEYYEPVGVGEKGSRWTGDGELGERLWGWTEGELKNWG